MPHCPKHYKKKEESRSLHPILLKFMCALEKGTLQRVLGNHAFDLCPVDTSLRDLGKPRLQKGD